MRLAGVLFAALLAIAGVAQGTIFGAGGNQVDDGWVIRFKPSTCEKVRGNHFEHPLLRDATIHREYNFNDGDFLAYTVTGIDADTIVALHELPEIMEISPNIRVSLHDTMFHGNVRKCEQVRSPSWGLSRTVVFGRVPPSRPIEDVPYEWDTETCGKGIEVHVFDTGVYDEHRDFGGRVVWGLDGTGEGEFDGHGHGTHVASTAAGSNYGLARCTKIVAVKVLNSEGAGNLFSILAGIEYSVEEARKGKKIVANFSLGALRNDLLNGIVEEAVKAGILVVAAAGNSDENAEYFSPASAKGVFTIAASTKDDVRAEFSNWGPICDIFAPGHMITGAWIGEPEAERTVSGTSMACPHGSGVAAVAWSKRPSFTNTDVINHLVRTATLDVITDTKDTPNRLLFNNCAN